MIFVTVTFFLTLFSGSLTESQPIECTTPNGDIGKCVSIKDCKILFEQIIKENKSAYKFLKESECNILDRSIKMPLVCCGLYGNYIDSDGFKLGKKPIEKQPKKSSPFPENCGNQKNVLNNRIIGGSQASLGEFPWIARLKHLRSDGIAKYGCAGFLVAPSYVITAAHCLKSKGMLELGKLYEVQLGEYNTEMYEDCIETSTMRFCADQPQYIKAGKPIIHPEYDNTSKSFHYDIAILPLKEPANFTDFVQPICLSQKPTQEQEMWVSGWGKTENGSSSPIKLKVPLRRVDRSYCRQLYETIDSHIVDSQICAGGELEMDSCHGDSGGPLMIQKGTEPFEAEGVVSFGYGCGIEGWPGVYTSIPDYYPWIKKMINRHMRMTYGRKLRKTTIISI